MNSRESTAPPEPFTPELPELRAGLVMAQGRVLDVVADGSELRGSALELARRLGVPVEDLTAAIRELVAIGWLLVETEADGELTLRWADASQ